MNNDARFPLLFFLRYSLFSCPEGSMSRLTATRLAVAATLVTACTGAAIVASPKSAATMQKAAALFVDSLSPDQKAKASFPFDSEERMRWHFIPNEMFPRKG